MDRKDERGDELKELEPEAAREALTRRESEGIAGATSMTGGPVEETRQDPATGRSTVGGSRPDLGAGGERRDNGGPAPVRSDGGEAPGSGGGGSLGASTYDDSGNLTGPDGPAGDAIGRGQAEAGQGDPLANRLGGGEGTGTGMTGGGAVTGDAGAARSEGAAAEPAATGAGEPGGMRGASDPGSGKPPGGVSPVEAEADETKEADDGR